MSLRPTRRTPMESTSEPPRELTPPQRAALDFIWAYTQEHRFPPSYGDIAAARGIRSSNGVSWLLGQLQARGYVRREKGTRRTLQVLWYFDAAGELVPAEQLQVPPEPAKLEDLAAAVRAWQSCACEYVNCEHARAVYYFKLQGLPKPRLSELLDKRAELAAFEAQLARTGTNERSMALSEGREGAYRGAAELARSYEAGGAS